jgi:uncharacterized protein (TIGR00299 family) protein
MMKVAYFDCMSGISGDMTLSALLDVGARLESVQDAVESMGLSGVRLEVGSTARKGFRGLLLRIEHPPEHAHRNLLDIVTLIRRADISVRAKDLAMRIFERLARAEARVHGTTLERVHFHEVGAIDSIIDIVGVSIAWDELGIERAYASPVPTGTGTVKIAHGEVAIPAPATAELLKEIPIASSGLPFELTTPTGAAILSELVSEYGPMPAMQVSRIGYGSGQRELPDRPNLLRILVGHALATKHRQEESEPIWVLETNLDDISGEQIGFAIEMAWQAGALDVFTTPIQMKKNRPGTMLSVLCRREERKQMESILLRHTGTLGVRHRKQWRVVVPRAQIEIDTPWGVVSGKVSKLPTGEIDFSPEYEDCSQIARENSLRLVDVFAEVKECYYEQETVRAPLRAESDAVVDSETAEGEFADRINAAFQRAAVEDQESVIRNPSETIEGAIGSNSTERSFANEENEEIDTFYRWDSSPWEDRS